MQRYPKQLLININHDYEVVINIHKVIIQHNMKLNSTLESVIKPSPISEGVAEIRINSQPCKGINLTTRHTWATKAPQVHIVHDVIKKSGWVLTHPSAIFHENAWADTPWVAQHYLI
jgi:hypothetical protein